jgi:hypothetical protein
MLSERATEFGVNWRLFRRVSALQSRLQCDKRNVSLIEAFLRGLVFTSLILASGRVEF